MCYRPYSALKATGLEVQFQNGAGATIPKATPTRKTPAGYIDFINVSVESEVLAFVGVTSAAILDNAIGPVITHGRIENVTISANFGDAIYLGKNGFLTNIKPDVGVGGFVSGDFVVRVATIARNETNLLQKDLVLEITLVGQLG
jgi:hypothetical protein